MLRPGTAGHKALMAVVCLSVCLSVCSVPDPKSRIEVHSKLKIAERKPMTRVTRDLIYSRNIKGQGHPVALRRDRKSIRSGISSERHTNFKLGIRMEYDDPHHRHARRPHKSPRRGHTL